MVRIVVAAVAVVVGGIRFGYFDRIEGEEFGFGRDLGPDCRSLVVEGACLVGSLAVEEACLEGAYLAVGVAFGCCNLVVEEAFLEGACLAVVVEDTLVVVEEAFLVGACLVAVVGDSLAFGPVEGAYLVVVEEACLAED